jgi:diguanylate cyclase (GGDEF)-like protein
MTLTSSTATPRVRVLAVDDEPMNLELLQRSLRRQYDVLTAVDPEQALELLRDEPEIALILSDYRMPQMSGAEFLRESMGLAPFAKRVIITGYSDVDNIIASVNSGQIHYVVKKPWNHQELDRVLRHLVHIHQLEAENRSLIGDLHRANEELCKKEALLARSLDDRSRELVDANSELARINDELVALSYKDTLTRLYNHRAFQDRIREELARARRYRQPLAVVLGDIDRFRAVNQQYGHQLGDEILRGLADLMSSAASSARLRDSDIVARYGGEEFAILLPETGKAGAVTKAERLRAAIAEQPFGADTTVTLSFGVAAYPDDAETSEELVACAERALRRAKSRGRDLVLAFDADDDSGAARDDPTQERRTTDAGPTPEPPSAAVGDEQFPTYHQHLLGISDALELDRAINCLYVDLSQLRRVELEYGVHQHAELFVRAGRVLDGLRGDRLRYDDIVCRTEDGDAYVCFLTATSAGPGDASARDLDAIAQRVQASLESALAPVVQDLIRDYPRITVGYGRVLNNSMVRPERLVTRLIGEARESAELISRRTSLRDKALLQDIILNDRLEAVFQPLVHLVSGEVFGYEALTRGPRRTPMENPTALFAIADEVGLTFELDRACFRRALRSAIGVEPVRRLFVNLLPLSFYDASFVENEVGSLLEAAALTPANVVFEITERLAIENFSAFRRALAGYTAMGFGVAIDDVGTRHSNLETVMALRPHFIKVSDVLTRGVARSTVKREMLCSLGKIAATIDAVVVAEGIENPDDLAAVRDLDVHYGQGFFLARPGPPFPRLSASVSELLQTPSPAAAAPIEVPAVGFDDDGEFRDDPEPITGVHRRVVAIAARAGATSALDSSASDRPDDPHPDQPAVAANAAASDALADSHAGHLAPQRESAAAAAAAGRPLIDALRDRGAPARDDDEGHGTPLG